MMCCKTSNSSEQETVEAKYKEWENDDGSEIYRCSTSDYFRILSYANPQKVFPFQMLWVSKHGDGLVWLGTWHNQFVASDASIQAVTNGHPPSLLLYSDIIEDNSSFENYTFSHADPSEMDELYNYYDNCDWGFRSIDNRMKNHHMFRDKKMEMLFPITAAESSYHTFMQFLHSFAGAMVAKTFVSGSYSNLYFCTVKEPDEMPKDTEWKNGDTFVTTDPLTEKQLKCLLVIINKSDETVHESSIYEEEYACNAQSHKFSMNTKLGFVKYPWACDT